MYYRRRIMLTISHAWQGMTAWVNSASRGVTALLAAAAGRLRAAPESKTEGDGRVSFMVLRLLRARGDSDTKSGGAPSFVPPVSMGGRGGHGLRLDGRDLFPAGGASATFTGHQDTAREVAQALACGVVGAAVEPIDFCTDTETTATPTPLLKADAPGAESSSELSAGFEANRHAWLGDCEAHLVSRSEQAGAVACPLNPAEHEGRASSGLEVATIFAGWSVDDLLTVGDSATDNDTGLRRVPASFVSGITESATDDAVGLTGARAGILHTESGARSIETGLVALWYPSIITADGALYVRQTWGGMEIDANTVHIT